MVCVIYVIYGNGAVLEIFLEALETIGNWDIHLSFQLEFGASPGLL